MVYLLAFCSRHILLLTLTFSYLGDFYNVKCQQTEAKYPEHTSAVFYSSSSKKGVKYSYRESSSRWSNIPQMLTGRNGQKIKTELLCVSGVWILYDEPGYKAGDSDIVDLLSGNNICINSSETKIGSMQPVSPTTFSKTGSIALFKREKFGSPTNPVSAAESKLSGVTQLPEPISPIGSIVVVGNGDWALMNSKGKVVCIRPAKEDVEGLKICHGVNLLSSQIEGFHVDTVYPGCPADHDHSLVANLKLTSCDNFGTEEPVPLQVVDIMGRSLFDSDSASNLECRPNQKQNDTKLTQEETDFVMKFIKLRLTHDFSADEQLLWPDNAADIWKTVPFDLAFDIVIETVPQSIVNAEYLRIIREFTVYHLNEIWKGKASAKDNQRWRSHRVINHLLGQCLKMAKEKDFYSKLINDAYTTQGKLEEFISKIHPAFVMNMKNDPIIETAWVVANYVMGLCHEIFKYQINFWDNFVTTFRQMYFIPLAEKWTKPNISPAATRLALSGFGTETQYKRIAFVTSLMLQLTPNFHPFEGTRQNTQTYKKTNK